ncbi:glycosyltransferase [Croceicoccus sp. F390]|uniref:Glycosyltransferase n=1 Tax=Croceicoccus esteveae TaxID=3075597 RepID=A0ABU2ZN81_9SPHN|nr:glycosyltransferase [Croceicoccus sp. F390]MDT0576887.1 glycosyltransferase [Croceicoccus sp. F390]
MLFTSGRAFLPQNSGGVQSSTMQLCAALVARGHDVAVLCRLSGGGWTALDSRIKRRVFRTRFSRDTRLGLPVFRAWDPTDTREVVSRFRPDVAVVQSGDTVPIARSLDQLGVPVVLYYRHVAFEDMGGNPAELSGAQHVANSRFTAARVQDRFGVTATVIPPLVLAQNYRTTSTRQNVTFINPYPVKGRDLAFDIAQACPDIPFVFCESWDLNLEMRSWINNRLKDLHNVTLKARTSDMKSIYGKARILLAPSLWEEAWGRVATEAQFSGIPVIGSRQGGLPEAIGPGGVTLDATAPLADWVAAVRRLWEDADYYQTLSEAALSHSRRSEIDPEHQTDRLMDVLAKACATGPAVQI